MEIWLKTCLFLCCYGFFKELRPSEPFLTEYLLGPSHNLTENQVYYGIYPVWTYSYLSLLVVIFLCTDLLRFKPIIVLEGIGYVATWCLLLWARGVQWMQLMEFCYAVTTSTEVAYFTYIYAQVDGAHYQKVTSYTWCALLTGRFISSVLSQVLYSTGLLDYHSLNYVSLGSVTAALCIAVFLPPVKKSIYFHRERHSQSIDEPSETDTGREVKKHSPPLDSEQKTNFCRIKIAEVCSHLWNDVKHAYSNQYLLKWSIWSAFATCINLQILNYIQPLWESVSPFQETERIYNAAVEASSTLIGALATFGVGCVHLNWMLFGELIVALISLLDASLLILMGLTSEIWVAYINYIVFRVSYQILITVASYQVAKELKDDSYGLIFGVNMFAGLLTQTVLTLVVVEWLEIEPGLQFVIYGVYFAVLSMLFFVFSIYTMANFDCGRVCSQNLSTPSSSVGAAICETTKTQNISKVA